MGKLYEEQEDGSLKPVEISEKIAKRFAVYRQLKEGLSFDEVRFLLWQGDLFDSNLNGERGE